MQKTILLFDTETTGLPKSGKPLDEQPHIVQLAYILAEYDTETYQYWIMETEDIICDPGVQIPEEVSKIHGITNEIAEKHPVFGKQAGEFFRLALQVDFVVGHNIDFDMKMVMIEAQRIWPDENKRNAWHKEVDEKALCTMQSSIKMCQLPFPSGRAGYKWPKLQELHKFLFDKEFDSAHNAVADIEATMRCFIELHKRKKIVLN